MSHQTRRCSTKVATRSRGPDSAQAAATKPHGLGGDCAHGPGHQKAQIKVLGVGGSVSPEASLGSQPSLGLLPGARTSLLPLPVPCKDTGLTRLGPQPEDLI